jgi:hypothetical protein
MHTLPDNAANAILLWGPPSNMSIHHASAGSPSGTSLMLSMMNFCAQLPNVYCCLHHRTRHSSRQHIRRPQTMT